MFVSIHIPNTGGAAIGEMLRRASGNKIIFDYDDYNQPKIPNTTIKSGAKYFEELFVGIHGHFYANKYSDVFQDPIKIACVRHPVERIISQYKEELVNSFSGRSNWRTDDLMDGRMDIVSFVASDENIRCCYTVHFDGVSVSDFDHIFLDEEIGEGVRDFSEKYASYFQYPDELIALSSQEDRSIIEDNYDRIKYEKLTEVDQKYRDAIFNLIPEDVALYEEAKQLV